MSKLQDYPYLSSISEDDKVLIVRNNDQGLAKISDLPIKGDVPEQLRQEMNAVFNKKFGTAKTYPPKNWPDDVNLMGALKEKISLGDIAIIEDGADDVPCKNVVVTLPASLEGYSSVDVVSAGKNLVNIPNSAEITRNQLNSNVVPLLDDFLNGKKGNFTISGKTAETVENANFITIRINYTDGTSSSNFYIYRGSTHESGGITGTFSISSDPTKIIDSVSFGGNTGMAKCAVSEWQVEANSQATTYEPYTAPTTHTASLGRTIYGGRVDIVNGTGTDENGNNFTFEGQEVPTRLGYNAFYSDSGDIEVTYRSNGNAETPITPTLVTKSIDSNGTYRAEDDDADGYSEVTVDIPSPTPPVLEEKTVTTNGIYRAEDDNADGYSEVIVNVPASTLGSKTITQNGTYDPEDDNLDGYSGVTVNVPQATLGTKTITQNGTYQSSDDNADGYSSVVVNVSAANLDSKEITQNGIYIPQDDDLDGYSAVSVNVAEPTLIEKEITENGTYSASDDDADGYSEVTVNTPVRGDLLSMLAINNSNNRLTLTDEVLNSTATKIRQYTFYKAYIGSINLNLIEEVESYAFYQGRCSNIVLPNCTILDSYAFYKINSSDDNITTHNLKKVKTIGAQCFYESHIAGNLNLEECESIGENAFRSCSRITGISLPKLKTVDKQAFNFCSWSFDIDLPSIVTIGNNAFNHVSSTNFTIGENCTSIGSGIFNAGSGVTNLYVMAETPPTLSGRFKGSGTDGVVNIFVPEDSVDIYKAANMWSNYADKIQPISN